jgi:F0F1-type ATP synthase membrane subunit c/vacuolar-type H+-ATPase subunit K
MRYDQIGHTMSKTAVYIVIGVIIGLVLLGVCLGLGYALVP